MMIGIAATAAAAGGGALRAAETAAPVAAKAAALPPAPKTVAELRAALEAHTGQARFSGSLWSVKVVSLETGATLYERDARRLMSPASNSKLYTGALALDRLGPDYRIVTPIFATAAPDAAGTVRGDLIVSGRGDPSWKSRGTTKTSFDAVAPLVDAIAAAGVKRVTGDLVADATYFRGPPNGAGWTADDLNDYYGAEVSALTLEENYAELRVAPGAAAGEPCTVTWLQPLAHLPLDVRLTTRPAGAETQLAARRLFDERTVHLFGGIAVGKAPATVDVTVPRPAEWFGRVLREALAQRGIRVEGGVRGVRWPEASPVGKSAVRLAEVKSPPLAELVKAFMKPSQNLETDLIFNHAGELTRKAETPELRSSEDLGVAVLGEFLQKHGLPAGEVRFEEGSGLSRNNLTTANATTALLVKMAAHPAQAAFYESLPIAGVDGTIRRRMKGTPAEGNVRAKTGTLRYANSLSGYVTTAAGERLAFSAMLNRNVNQPAGRSVSLEVDEVAVWLARLEGRSAP